MPEQVLLCCLINLRCAGFGILSPGENLTLDIISRRAPDKVFEAPISKFEPPIQRMQLVAAHEVEGGKHAVDRFAHNRDVSRWLRKDRMKPKQHMALEDTCLPQSFF